MSPERAVEIRNTTRGSYPRIPFERIAHELLGARYRLSLVICGDALAKKMNSTYRKKRYSPNVLSFPLGKFEGEIFLNIRVAAREAKHFGVSMRARLALLFAHGCMHLKGMKHGTRMEAVEKRIVKKLART